MSFGYNMPCRMMFMLLKWYIFKHTNGLLFKVVIYKTHSNGISMNPWKQLFDFLKTLNFLKVCHANLLLSIWK